MRIGVDKLNRLEGQHCFICGKPLLSHRIDDLAYIPVIKGGSVKAKPERYYLFQCPSCNKIGHKRCWYDVADRPVGGGIIFGPKGREMKCPACGYLIAPLRKEWVEWIRGYQIPGHPDEELFEIWVGDVNSYKAGAFISKIGAAIGGLFRAVKLGSLTASEKSAVSEAAQRVGKSFSDLSQQVFRLDVSQQDRQALRDLRCMHCSAPLPSPGQFDDAIVCQHCGTAHLLK